MFFRRNYKSPNFDERANGQAPSMIILHYTGMETGKAALDRLCDPAAKVSAHYVIDEKGKSRQLVEDNKRAWHAGVSYWSGERDINSASIGIEIVNRGHEHGYHAFSERQLGTVGFVCLDLIERFNIPPHRILGHSDIAITRKIDPGHYFPWERLAERGIGLWPTPNEMDLAAAPDLLQSPESFHALLCGFGYDPEMPPEETITAFHRHFYPEQFKHWEDKPGTPDILSCAKLLSLVRQKNAQTEKPLL
jgi:N-acetylmuramoyl-L-alanine amidase